MTDTSAQAAAPGKLAGKVALVTGGASGIGEGTVRRLAADGASVVIADIQSAAAAKLADELGARCRAIGTDVTSEIDVAAAVDLAVAEFGRLDVAFANAGIFGAYGPIEKSKMADVDLTWAVDLRGVFVTMKHAARVMIPQSSGVIIATTSPAAVVGGIGNHAYSAAKAGILGLMRSVAAELRGHGIRVNAVMPGAVVSAMTADLVLGDATAIDEVTQAMTADAARGRPRPGLPADIAAAVSFLASDDASFVTGHVMVVDGGLTAIGGDSPFARGKYAEPGALLEAGRRS
jgi:NAD(P)-dependent dehydrogenase (short-subunit alcohol dehydrogenase family)